MGGKILKREGRWGYLIELSRVHRGTRLIEVYGFETDVEAGLALEQVDLTDVLRLVAGGDS